MRILVFSRDKIKNIGGYPYTICFCFVFFKILSIHLKECACELGVGWREREKQTVMKRQPDVELEPRMPGLRPKLKADTY